MAAVSLGDDATVVLVTPLTMRRVDGVHVMITLFCVFKSVSRKRQKTRGGLHSQLSSPTRHN